jgi:hypothetical protein
MDDVRLDEAPRIACRKPYTDQFVHVNILASCSAEIALADCRAPPMRQLTN